MKKIMLAAGLVGGLALALFMVKSEVNFGLGTTEAGTATTTDFSNWKGLQMPEGYQPDNTEAQGNAFITSDGLLAFMAYKDGPRVIKLATDPTTYWVSEHNLKLPMHSEKVFLSYNNKWEDVETVSQEEFAYYGDASFIKLIGTTKVYLLEEGLKRYVPQNVVEGLGVDVDIEVIGVNSTEFNSYKTGTNVSLDE